MHVYPNFKKDWFLVRSIPSVANRLHPLSQWLGTIVLIAIALIGTSFFQQVLIYVFAIFLAILFRISWYRIFKTMRPMLRIILMTSLIQAFTTVGRDVIFSWGFLILSSQGIMRASFVFINFSLLLLILNILGLSTKPMAMVAGLSMLLKPLRVIGLKTNEFAMLVGLSFRFIPTLNAEFERLKKAQIARGVDFESGDFFTRIRKTVPLLKIVFFNSFYQAELLGNSLDMRGFDVDGDRSSIHTYRWGVFDLAYLTCVGIIAVIVLLI